jgi:hypothetical protein
VNDGIPGSFRPDLRRRFDLEIARNSNVNASEAFACTARASREVLMLKGRGNVTAGLGLIIFGLAFANGPMAGQAAAQGTAQQQMACQSDAFRLCGQYIPDADSVKACMVKQIRNLSPDCRSQFSEGGGAKKVNAGATASPALDRNRPM